jgi:hypothetical protein
MITARFTGKHCDSDSIINIIMITFVTNLKNVAGGTGVIGAARESIGSDAMHTSP